MLFYDRDDILEQILRISQSVLWSIFAVSRGSEKPRFCWRLKVN